MDRLAGTNGSARRISVDNSYSTLEVANGSSIMDGLHPVTTTVPGTHVSEKEVQTGNNTGLQVAEKEVFVTQNNHAQATVKPWSTAQQSTQPNFVKVERYGDASTPMLATNQGEQGTSKIRSLARRKRVIAAVIVLLIAIVVIAIAVPVALAKRSTASQQQDQSSPATSPSTTPAASSATRQRSTHGAWNGTGIGSASLVGVGGHAGYVTFQHADGVMGVLRFTVDETSKQVTSQDLSNLTQTAANGTAIFSTGVISPPTLVLYRTVYVDKNGCLADMTLQSDRIGSAWASGDLAKTCFKAPTDNRAAMHMDSSRWYDSDASTATIDNTRLWAGGVDGALHQYVYDTSSKSWSNSDFVLPGSYGYGLVSSRHADPFSADGTETTLFTSLSDGSVQLYTSKDGSGSDNSTNYPSGKWSGPIASPGAGVVAANSSAAFVVWDSAEPALIYPKPDGHLGNMSVSADYAATGQVGGSAHTVANAGQIMQGSDFSFFEWNSPTNNAYLIFFYQQTGDDISWMMFNGSTDSLVGQGSLDLSP